jgi:hypothetical protein
MVCVFIGVSVCTCINIYVFTMFVRKIINKYVSNNAPCHADYYFSSLGLSLLNTFACI